MADDALSKRKVKYSTKVKTGCTTCRIRKIKCDENKPSCKKCASTGRTCDGYDSPFRIVNNQANKRIRIQSVESNNSTQLKHPNYTKTGSLDIDLLSRYFSTKTMFDVKLGCEEEAKQVLEASMTDPSIRHAVLSLKALREDLETSGDDPMILVQPSSSYHYGLQQYNIALGGLASRLTAPSANSLKSALLCCQVFISIEQLRKNYTAMVQHIIQGLGIMHEYGARPRLAAGNKLVPANQSQLPFLDVFVIKLFAAPCKFADQPSTAGASTITPSGSLNVTKAQDLEFSSLRALAPDMRTKLQQISASTIVLLDKVLHVQSIEATRRLVAEKADLLDLLNSWLIEYEVVRMEPEPIRVSFLRMFQMVLKIVLLQTLDSAPDLYAELQSENDQLQSLANGLGERLKTYVTSVGQEDRSTVSYKVV